MYLYTQYTTPTVTLIEHPSEVLIREFDLENNREMLSLAIWSPWKRTDYPMQFVSTTWSINLNTEHVIIAHRMTQAVRLAVTYIYEWQVSRDNRGIRFESIVE